VSLILFRSDGLVMRSEARFPTAFSMPTGGLDPPQPAWALVSREILTICGDAELTGSAGSAKTYALGGTDTSQAAGLTANGAARCRERPSGGQNDR